MASLLPKSVRSVEGERREGKGKSGQVVVAPQAAGKVYFITDGESGMSVRFCVFCTLWIAACALAALCVSAWHALAMACIGKGVVNA